MNEVVFLILYMAAIIALLGLALSRMKQKEGEKESDFMGRIFLFGLLCLPISAIAGAIGVGLMVVIFKK